MCVSQKVRTLTVSLGQEYENEEVAETLSEPGPSIKRYLQARPLRWGKRGGSSPLQGQEIESNVDQGNPSRGIVNCSGTTMFLYFNMKN